MKILEPGTETEVADGQIGELVATGPYTLRGYFDAAEHNATAFTSDGFFRTGDLASIQSIDGQRYISLEGRIKDLINRGGEKINSAEVEGLLLKHPAVVDAALISMPDERLGERACAYVVVTEGSGLNHEGLRQHFAALGVAKFKWPERVEIVEQLPRTPVGKIDKKSLHADVVAKLDAERGELQQPAR